MTDGNKPLALIQYGRAVKLDPTLVELVWALESIKK